LTLDPSLAENYKSKQQMVRVVTEDWGRKNLYCAACNAESLTPLAANRRARDFECPHCLTTYQLKARSRAQSRVTDSAYQTMLEAIKSDAVPALYILTYTHHWVVRDLLLVHPAFFSESCIVKRNPIRPGKLREGWVGCDILLNRIAPAGILEVVRNGVVTSPRVIRDRYRQARSLRQVAPSQRGWTLDVLRVVQRLPETFTLADVYRFEEELSALYPQNSHVKDKIRQQLQVLRDLGYVAFLGNGKYRRIE
jgi:type II restriction enzyme